MGESRPDRGLIDTSVVMDLEQIDPADLPQEIAISAITLLDQRGLSQVDASGVLGLSHPR